MSCVNNPYMSDLILTPPRSRFRSASYLVCVLLLCCIISITGASYYTSPWGSPEGPGNQLITDDPEPRTIGNVSAVDYRTTPPYGNVPMMVMFTAHESDDIDWYLWQFGTASGYSSTERIHWFEYQEPGTYTATLTIGTGNHTHTATLDIVAEPPGIVPLMNYDEGMW